MLENGGHDGLPVGSIDPVTGSLQKLQPRSGDLFGKRLGSSGRRVLVTRAIDQAGELLSALREPTRPEAELAALRRELAEVEQGLVDLGAAARR